MSLLDGINLAVGLMSLTLGGLAIWLSIHFYDRAKDSEKATALTLEAIRTQSEALQKLTGRWMDRLTRHVTEPRPADEGLIRLVDVVANLPTAILTHIELRAQSSGTSGETMLSDLIGCYICLYHYSAMANVLAQAQLPVTGEIDASDDEQVTTRNIVDNSAADFNYMAAVLNQIPPAKLQSNQYANLLNLTVSQIQPEVRLSTEALQLRRDVSRAAATNK